MAGAAYSYDNPNLLPQKQTPIIDLAKSLNNSQRLDLEKSLTEYEKKNGWKIRVLTQYEKTPGIAVKNYWGLDERSLLIVADPRGGNLLNFNVGEAYFALMPRIFWVELQTRYGNQYYVRDNGEDGSILSTISAVETCLDKGGCEVVPGLPKEQWLWTLSTSILGGLVAGIAAFPRKGNEKISMGWLLLFSPLWVMLFGVFGIAPIITRTNEYIPLLINSISFLTSTIGGYIVAKSIFPNREE